MLEIAEGKVLVQYLERADVPNEWLPTDASHVRAVDDEAEQERRKEPSLLEASKDAKLVEAAAAAAPASAPAPRARAGKRPAFPTGSPLVAGAHDCESVAASLLLFEFFSASERKPVALAFAGNVWWWTDTYPRSPRSTDRLVLSSGDCGAEASFFEKRFSSRDASASSNASSEEARAPLALHSSPCVALELDIALSTSGRRC